jgi:hypothetical protein
VALERVQDEPSKVRRNVKEKRRDSMARSMKAGVVIATLAAAFAVATPAHAFL